MTFIDDVHAAAVLIGLALNSTLGWWWADPPAGFVLGFDALRESSIVFGQRRVKGPMVNQAEFLPDLANPAFQANANEAIHRFIS